MAQANKGCLHTSNMHYASFFPWKQTPKEKADGVEARGKKTSGTKLDCKINGDGTSERTVPDMEANTELQNAWDYGWQSAYNTLFCASHPLSFNKKKS